MVRGALVHAFGAQTVRHRLPHPKFEAENPWETCASRLGLGDHARDQKLNPEALNPRNLLAHRRLVIMHNMHCRIQHVAGPGWQHGRNKLQQNVPCRPDFTFWFLL